MGKGGGQFPGSLGHKALGCGLGDRGYCRRSWPRGRRAAAEGALYRFGNVPGFGTVVLRNTIQDYKEGEQKRNEIGVGDQPTIRTRTGQTAAVRHRPDLLAAGWGLTVDGTPGGVKAFSSRKFSRRIRIRCEFRPSAIARTPSTMSSRVCISWRARKRSLAAAGNSSRLADATPYTVATKATAMPFPISETASRCFIT